MAKFFLPKQKGSTENPSFSKDKKKKKFNNCNESLSSDIFNVLKRLHMR